MIISVLDTNIFVSGIFWEGNFCSQIINAWKQGKIALVSSILIIEELVKTLRDFKIQMPGDMIEEWKNIIIQNSIIVEPRIKVNIVEKHPADNIFIETAIEGNAEYIISQDKHLLDIKEYQGIKIIKPEEFLKIINK